MYIAIYWNTKLIIIALNYFDNNRFVQQIFYVFILYWKITKGNLLNLSKHFYLAMFQRNIILLIV